MRSRIIFFTMLTVFAINHSSCTVSLKLPRDNTRLDSLQRLSPTDLSKFNGDYKIFSTDSTRTSSMMFTYSDKFDFTDESDSNAYVNLRAINDHKIAATLYNNGKIIRKRKIRGVIKDDYFYFKMARYKSLNKRTFYVLGVFASQSSRIGLTNSGNIIGDTDWGGFLLLVVMPAFGSTAGRNNVVFERKRG